MLGKLMKHEFRATGRIGLPLCGAMLALAVIAGLTLRFFVTEWSTFLYGISGTLPMILFVLSIFAVAVGIFVILMQNYKRNLLGDEGYLMRTLPVSLHELLLSKLFVALLWYIAAMVMINLSVLLFVLLTGEVKFGELGKMLAELRGAFTYVTFGSLLRGFLGWLGFSAFLTLLFYADFTMSQSFSKHKVLYNVLAVVIFIVLLRLVFGLNETLGETIFLPADSSVGVIGGADGPTQIYVTGGSYVGLIELYLFDVLLYFLTWAFLKYKPNLE